MDDPLKKKQSDATFEMKSLIYRNSGLLKQSESVLSEESRKIAKEATKLLIDQAEERKMGHHYDNGEASSDDEELAGVFDDITLGEEE